MNIQTHTYTHVEKLSIEIKARDKCERKGEVGELLDSVIQ